MTTHDYHLYRWHCYDERGFVGYVEMVVDGNPTKEDETEALYRAQCSLSTCTTTRLSNRTYLG